MTTSLSRRDLLRTVVTATGAAALTGAASPRRRIGIVGAGMAGVSLAWLLDGQHDVVLIEAAPMIGGNVRSIDVELDGSEFVVDMGAQYFHPGPYPLYTALLARLGLYPPDSTAANRSQSFVTSITVADAAEATPRFVSPIFFDRLWPLLAPWNLSGVGAFAVAFNAARAREQANASWSLTLEDWLPTLGLSRDQWEGMLLPWAASLFSGSIDQARGMSARAAMVFAAKALPANPLEPVLYYVLNKGLAEPLRRMLSQCNTVRVLTDAAVRHVVRLPRGGFTLQCKSGQVVTVDDLVFASSGPGTLPLLSQLPGTRPQQQALRGIEFHAARLALHTDPIYASETPAFRSFLNCRIEDGYCESSMHLATVVTDPPRAVSERLWKSWVTHRQAPAAEVLHEAEFQHLLPTPSTLSAQTTLARLQGRDGVWFAGGYLHPYDSQETALRSALGVAFGMWAAAPRGRALTALAIGEE